MDMDKALPKIGISQRTCQACGITLPEGCPLVEKLEHCRSRLHLQHFVQSQQLFTGSEIVPCDIDKQFRHLCLLCCCGVETPKTAEHLASAAHASQRVLASLPPAVSASSGPAGSVRDEDAVASRHTATPATVSHLWESLPSELVRAIVEASPRPDRCYIQLMGLSHGIRTAIRGALRELSFDDPSDPVLSELIRPTPDALAALIGPCKSLRKLTLSIPEGWCDLDEAAQGRCLDAIFAGHTQLAALEFRMGVEASWFVFFSESHLERILGHLPGLVELTCRQIDMTARLLAVLARSCPGLQALRCSIPYGCASPDWTALTPLSGTLKQLDLGSYSNPKIMAVLVCGLTAVTSLKLADCPPAALRPLAPHLSVLELIAMDDEDLPGPWLCRLTGLTLVLGGGADRPFSARLARLLSANQATLRNLGLSMSLPATEAPALVAALRGLPHLAGLHLAVSGDCSFAALMPPDLLDRLTRLEINIKSTPYGFDFATPEAADDLVLRIASPSLQRLSLVVAKLDRLVVACPALEQLTLGMWSDCLLSLGCPRLRHLQMPALRLAGDGAGAGPAPAPMPDLEHVELTEDTYWTNPAWLLAGGCPRLRVLSGVRLTRPDLLARLGACASLVRLEQLDVTWLRGPQVLRLPGQVEQLRLEIKASHKRGPLRVSPVDMCVEAPGLLVFDLGIVAESPSARVRLHNCPSLMFLFLGSGAASVGLQVDEDAGIPTMQPREISLDGGLEPSNLLDLLARHGARLCKLSLLGGALRGAAWPPLTQALSRLPRLTSLELGLARQSARLDLACPQLRRLRITDTDRVKVVLACPQLRELKGCAAPCQELEFVVPAPNLDPNDLRGFVRNL
ncbi:hypothetical protein PAPYR_4219 [Paratrimastix pyriformis]|uniref:Uncharacterized protein n=1 Tax=Paratrimastix pyriformis TaxID=342808 RepID=A0ABQ8ULX7_9EUKA|nr:hypothetical protein PAPYR_4219 [Paratrimastix pyriformis]